VARIIDAETLATRIDVDDPRVGGPLETRIVGDGSLLATITTGGASTLRDTVTGAVLYTAEAGSPVREASYDRQLVVVGGDTDPPQIVDVASGAIVTILDGPAALLPSFSSDGRWIWGYIREEGREAEIRIYDTRTGESPLGFVGAQSVQWMPEGKTISVVDGDGVLWHANLEALLGGKTLEEATLWSGFVTRDLFPPSGHVVNGDGTLVATKARSNEPVTVWDTTSGERVAVLDPNLIAGSPYIFFHPEHPYLSVLGDGGVLLTYTLDIDELVEEARSRLTRSLTDAECATFLHAETCPPNSGDSP
jgi:WD40 repeat protein